TWARNGNPPVTGGRRVNDDSASDNFSQGSRPQFQPSAAVDQTTGTLVLTWFDARYDAAEARVATFVATSIDGGQTSSPQLFAPVTATFTAALDPVTQVGPRQQPFLNGMRTALDAITRKVVSLEPIPSNQSAGNATRDARFNFGDHQGLAVADGHLYA